MKNNSMNEIPPVLTVQQFADYIGCAVKTVYKLVKSGDIKAFKLSADSRQLFIQRDELLRIMRG